MRSSFILPVLLCLAVGCGGTDSTTATTLSDQGLIGPEGGTVQVKEGPLAGASVVVPPGALTERIRITLSGAPDLSEEGFTPWGPALAVEPSGQSFLLPVEITLPVPALDEIPSSYLVAHAGTEEQEALIPHDAAEGASQVKVETDSFSTFQTMKPVLGVDKPTFNPRGPVPANPAFTSTSSGTSWSPLILPLSSDTFLTSGFNPDGTATANPLVDVGTQAYGGLDYDLRRLTSASDITLPGKKKLQVFVFSMLPLLATTDHAYLNLGQYYLNDPSNSIHPDPMPATQTANQVNSGQKSTLAAPGASSYDANTPVYVASNNATDDPFYFFPNLPNGRAAGKYTDHNGLTENVSWTVNPFLFTLNENLYDTGLYWRFCHGWASPSENANQTVQWNRLDDTNLVADNPGNVVLQLATNAAGDLISATVGLALANLNAFGTPGSADYYVNTDQSTGNPSIANVQQAPSWLENGAFVTYQPIPGFQCNLLRQQTPGGTYTLAENTSMLFVQSGGAVELPACYTGTTIDGPVPLVTQTWVDQHFVVFNNTDDVIPSTQDQYPGEEYYYLGNTFLPHHAGVANRWTHYPRMTTNDQPDERDTDCWMGLRGDTPWDVMAWMTGYTQPSSSLLPQLNNLMQPELGGQARKPYMFGASQQVVSTTDSTVEYTLRVENSNSFWWAQVPKSDSSLKKMYRATVYVDPDGDRKGYLPVATVNWVWKPLSFALADASASSTNYQWVARVSPNPNGSQLPVLGTWVPEFAWLVKDGAQGFPTGWVNNLPNSGTPQTYALAGPNGTTVSLTVNEALIDTADAPEAIRWSPPTSGPFSTTGFKKVLKNGASVNNLTHPELLRYTIQTVTQGPANFLVVLDKDPNR